MARLEGLFDEHKGDIVYKFRHYLRIYEQYFSKYVGKEVNIVEIGIGAGGSLQLWKKYFGEKCNVYGIDLTDYHTPEDKIKVFIGNQNDSERLKEIAKEIGRIDILIDDGSHEGPDQIITFETLFPLLEADGVYACEDLHTAYRKTYRAGYKSPTSFIEYCKHLVDCMHSQFIDDVQLPVMCNYIDHVSFYHILVMIQKTSDFGRLRDAERKGAGIV